MQERFWKIGREGDIHRYTHLPNVDVRYSQDQRVRIGKGVRYGMELQITNEERLRYKLILINTDPRIADVWMEDSRLVIQGLKPGTVTIRILVDDELFNFVTSDPEEDNPLVIDVEIV